MNGTRVTCGHCRRSWFLDVDYSIYLELDITSRACPFCEAHTLRCHGTSEPSLSEEPALCRRVVRFPEAG